MNIDVNEMMIGDWIQYYNDNGLQYRKFTADDFSLTEAEIEQNGYAPILLKPEMLYKKGFREVGHNVLFYDEYRGGQNKLRRIAIEFGNQNTITVSFDKERIVWTTQYTPCVHELQHLMRAMNFVKEIEL